jgi:hypothetical protein
MKLAPKLKDSIPEDDGEKPLDPSLYGFFPSDSDLSETENIDWSEKSA